VAGLGAASAIGGDGALGLAICHDSSGPPPSKDDGNAPNTSCPLCAVAAAALVLPAPGPIVLDRPVLLGSLVERLEEVVLVRPRRAVAGTARAPPSFA
jgi:hypothetical protein